MRTSNWHGAKSRLRSLQLQNLDGETHTFTEVQRFGGGVLDFLNVALGNPFPRRSAPRLSIGPSPFWPVVPTCENLGSCLCDRCSRRVLPPDWRPPIPSCGWKLASASKRVTSGRSDRHLTYRLLAVCAVLYCLTSLRTAIRCAVSS